MKRWYVVHTHPGAEAMAEFMQDCGQQVDRGRGVGRLRGPMPG